jgi:hydroxycarboxylate dehydrogenase B
MFSIIVDPGKLVDVPWMQHEVEAIAAHAKASPPANQEEPVLIPGEPELISLNERLAKGIPLDDASWEQILVVGEALGLEREAMLNLM